MSVSLQCAAWPSVHRTARGHRPTLLGGAHRIYRYHSALALYLGLLSLLGSVAPAADFTTARVAVYFSPTGGATDAVVREVHAATQQILVQAYSFTSAPIAKALLDAHKRGVQILAVLDKSNETQKYSAATFLVNAGIQTLIDDCHVIAHSKVIVIDSATIITGSFNFTKKVEESNVENLLVIQDAPELVKVYEANVQAHAPMRTPIGEEPLQLQPVLPLQTTRETYWGTAMAKCTGYQAVGDTLA
jgi:phosphatidylserine/phosphatidylglycerophosphate/cardiolipin synthase-like enzyme